MTEDTQDREEFLKETKRYWFATGFRVLMASLFGFILVRSIEKYAQEGDPLQMFQAIGLMVAIFLGGCRTGYGFKREYLEE